MSRSLVITDFYDTGGRGRKSLIDIEFKRFSASDA